jgi:hypothetical protein
LGVRPKSGSYEASRQQQEEAGNDELGTPNAAQHILKLGDDYKIKEVPSLHGGLASSVPDRIEL